MNNNFDGFSTEVECFPAELIKRKQKYHTFFRSENIINYSYKQVVGVNRGVQYCFNALQTENNAGQIYETFRHYSVVRSFLILKDLHLSERASTPSRHMQNHC